MAWFRIEDSFHSHPKVKLAGNAAVGLWVRCGTWSAQYLTDGLVPTHIVGDLGKPREIEALVKARLWVPSDDGMLIPDFLDYNQSKGEVEARRKRDADRKRADREKPERGTNGQYRSPDR
jgi:hypothetical protein